ncbi:hypothetical protein ELY11_06585 [Legionella septentrionalis]|uniref:Inner membrane protein AmpE n=2 Tax=Legionellaceae TaxID=444 RepID=A0A3S0V612_9GAMM|nr:hypothetical protein [Legionella sp. 27cVA30]RUQ89514.1 hypothetical protein EKM59_03465 [Legionella septentrionalis]MCP0914467.1 hypothetical protein [Legionella sp. 27cVA30]RUQ97348.1 hypothetical protein ELY11_06585 [Legionella septentrionalis]RUR10528.1 hypothetical protein ELY14_05090 [Legionella septentrionalis]RUR16153.1 hypothetical protein ELY10_04165 [Legionella septentrionalis]
MKLLVIVLCLLSERYLMHASAHSRFYWFSRYANAMKLNLSKTGINAWGILASLILPIALAVFALFYLVEDKVFGFVGLILNIFVFYYCLGPDNPFYAKRLEKEKEITSIEVGDYLAQVNGQLFAVIFWYIVSGPVGVVIYRLISLCQRDETVQRQAAWLTGILDWAPAKLTSLLYLLVGNFQAGFSCFSELFFASPEKNQTMLSGCGLQAVGFEKNEQTPMPHAEMLVEHAVIVLLVFLAFFTLVAWL